MTVPADKKFALKPMLPELASNVPLLTVSCLLRVMPVAPEVRDSVPMVVAAAVVVIAPVVETVRFWAAPPKVPIAMSLEPLVKVIEPVPVPKS